MKVLNVNATLKQLAELSGDAIKVIQNILTDEKVSPSVKLRAAKLVLDAAAAVADSGTVSQTQHTPTPKPAPPRARDMAAARPVIVPDKRGRNEPCSCGSGVKYKKCCLTRPPQPAPAGPPLPACA